MVKYTYDAWGNTVTEVLDCNANAIAELNPFRYRGYYYDIETELYFLKSRYYDPELGRFMTIDDVSYLDPDTINGLNLYAYCGNNPVVNKDTNGKFPISAIVAAIILGGGISAGVSAVTQYFEAGEDWSKVNVNKVIYAGAWGVVNGLLAISGIKVKAAMALGAVLGATSSIISDLLFNNGQIDFSSLIINTIIGGASAGLAGSGSMDDVVKFVNSKKILVKTIVNETVKAIPRQTQAVLVHTKSLIIAGVRYLFANILGGAFSESLGD